MTDFLSLDEQTRAYALVGYFLQAWSLMECQLNDTIGEALELHPMQEKILCNNIQFRDRLNILRTLVSISALDDNEKCRIEKTLKRIEEYTRYRNIIAHTPFIPSETGDGVQFVAVRAKGALKFLQEDWSVEKFQEIDQTIGDFSNEFESLRDNLKISRAAMKAWAPLHYAKNPLSS